MVMPKERHYLLGDSLLALLSHVEAQDAIGIEGSAREDKVDPLGRLEAVLMKGQIPFRRGDDQLDFGVAGCGLTTAWFRVSQNGRLSTLIGEFGFRVPPEKRGLICEFCNAVNYYVLAFGSLELDPENGNVQLRHELLWPGEGTFGQAELGWFLGFSAKVIADVSRPVADLAFGSSDVDSALERVKQACRAQDARSRLHERAPA
jgi:hypothetical protein